MYFIYNIYYTYILNNSICLYILCYTHIYYFIYKYKCIVCLYITYYTYYIIYNSILFIYIIYNLHYTYLYINL